MILEERILVEGGYPRWDAGCVNWFGWADEWVSGDEGILSSRQDETEVAVLAPAAGPLD